jgi:hypothetical protein
MHSSRCELPNCCVIDVCDTQIVILEVCISSQPFIRPQPLLGGQGLDDVWLMHHTGMEHCGTMDTFQGCMRSAPCHTPPSPQLNGHLPFLCP